MHASLRINTWKDVLKLALVQAVIVYLALLICVQINFSRARAQAGLDKKQKKG